MSEMTELFRKYAYSRLDEAMRPASEQIKKDFAGIDLPFDFNVDEGTTGLYWKMITIFQLALVDWCMTYKGHLTGEEFMQLPEEDKLLMSAMRYIGTEFIDDLQGTTPPKL